MNAPERIRRILLIEKIRNRPEYAAAAGIRAGLIRTGACTGSGKKPADAAADEKACGYTKED